MKQFEMPKIEIDRFELVDTIAASSGNGSSSVDIIPSFDLPDDEFSSPEKKEAE